MEGGAANRVCPWSTIPDDAVEVISARTDALSLSRFGRAVPGIRDALRRLWHNPGPVNSIPYDLPCLLHSDPFTCPNDRTMYGNSTVGTMMPLDSPSMPASVVMEQGSRWAGYKRNWVAIVGESMVDWKLVNLVTGVSLDLPSVEVAGIHRTGQPLIFQFKGLASSQLVKIHIAKEPYFLDSGVWSYRLIAVFDAFIAILDPDCNDDIRWRLLSNNFLAPGFYRDAVWYRNRIFAIST